MIDFTDQAFDDLKIIYRKDAALASELFIRIEAMSEDQEILANLLSKFHKIEGSCNIKLYQAARKFGRYVYRIRFFKEVQEGQDKGVNDYRVFYFYCAGDKVYKILAVNEKYKRGNIDHPYDDPEFQRILKERYDVNNT